MSLFEYPLCSCQSRIIALPFESCQDHCSEFIDFARTYADIYIYTHTHKELSIRIKELWLLAFYYVQGLQHILLFIICIPF